MNKIAYKMWNRIVHTDEGDRHEVVVYDKDFNRLGKMLLTDAGKSELSGEWRSPLEIYSATGGTMGLGEVKMTTQIFITRTTKLP